MTFGADLRYFGQQNELTVFFEHDPRATRDVETIGKIFEAAYFAQYDVNPSHVPVEIVSWRLTVRGPGIATKGTAELPSVPGKPKTRRAILLWPDAGPVDIYDRSSLAAGQKFAGPAVVEERETTIVIPPGWDAEINESGCVVAKRRA